jgi:hypothetical protein
MVAIASELLAIVEKAAPLVGQALIGNYSAVALSLIQDVFGGSTPEETSQNVSNDPEAASKLKEIEDKHATALAKLAEADRESARAMVGVGLNRIRFWMGVTLIVLVVIDTIAIYFTHDSQVSHILIAILGGLAVELKNVFKLYFGG